MLPVITKYPLDPTGIDPNNLVVSEEHTMPRRTVRAIAPIYGGFYTESLIINDITTQRQLVKDQHFYCAELYEVPTSKFGKEVCGIILITDPTVNDTVSIAYQAVGGEFSTLTTPIIQMIEALNLDNRPINWPDILNKPDGFPAAKHLHDIGDTFGWEYVVHALDRVSAAIQIGDSIQHDAIYRYIDNVEQRMLSLYNSSKVNKIAETGDLMPDDVMYFLSQV